MYDRATGSEGDSPEHDAVVAALRLALTPGVGPRIAQSLLERFESPQRVLLAKESELRSVGGVGPKVAAAIVASRTSGEAEATLEECRRDGVELLLEASDDYPPMLREIADPPPLLFVRGSIVASDHLGVAIVGTRHATRYGLNQAERLASGLARAGVTVISGLARGIDAAAHKGALAAGGRTIAVLGSGVLAIYPPEHKSLAEEVVKSGALLSEAPPRRAPFAGAFPARNRIVTGMSLGVIVVEAAVRSGALISARLAMEQNREVFAVPGPVDSRVSTGCHRLLRDGAKLVETVDDILEELAPLVHKVTDAKGHEVHHPAELQLNEQERRVLDVIGNEPISIDDVASASGLPVHRVLSTISVLEMRRLTRRLSGNLVTRA
jgi:DNA processing protein